MKRRDLLGLAGTAVAGSFALGTGAFSVARADRTITVGVEEDYDAYLKLEELGSGDRSEIDGGTLEMNVPGDDETDYNAQAPEGVGTDSVYWFGRDAGGNTGDGLFRITNRGTDPVTVFGTQSNAADVPSVSMFGSDGLDLLTEDDPSDPIGVGESIRCGIRIDTHGVGIREAEYSVTLTINATTSY